MESFTVYGEPQGKARPRHSQGHTYTPKETREYEERVRNSYKSKCKSFYGKGTELTVTITAYFSIAKSTSKKSLPAMLAGTVRPTKRPDLDNIAKIILDALNGTAYHDDSQVVVLNISKRYADIPCVSVVISERL